MALYLEIWCFHCMPFGTHHSLENHRWGFPTAKGATVSRLPELVAAQVIEKWKTWKFIELRFWLHILNGICGLLTFPIPMFSPCFPSGTMMIVWLRGLQLAGLCQGTERPTDRPRDWGGSQARNGRVWDPWHLHWCLWKFETLTHNFVFRCNYSHFYGSHDIAACWENRVRRMVIGTKTVGDPGSNRQGMGLAYVCVRKMGDTVTGWWFGTFFIFPYIGIIIPID